jgi:hypothetical protein
VYTMRHGLTGGKTAFQGVWFRAVAGPRPEDPIRPSTRAAPPPLGPDRVQSVTTSPKPTASAAPIRRNLLPDLWL